jgi:hypothetical protein
MLDPLSRAIANAHYDDDQSVWKGKNQLPSTRIAEA